MPFYLKLPGPLPFLLTTAHIAAVVSLSIHLAFIHHSNLNYERQTSGAGQRVQDRADLLQGYLLDWAMVMKLTVIFQLSELTTILHTTRDSTRWHSGLSQLFCCVYQNDKYKKMSLALYAKQLWTCFRWHCLMHGSELRCVSNR